MPGDHDLNLSLFGDSVAIFFLGVSFTHLPKANRPFDLLVVPCWLIFSEGPKG